MTVKELKEALDKFPDEMDVMIKDEFFGDPSFDIYNLEQKVYDFRRWIDGDLIKDKKKVVVFNVC